MDVSDNKSTESCTKTLRPQNRHGYQGCTAPRHVRTGPHGALTTAIRPCLSPFTATRLFKRGQLLQYRKLLYLFFSSSLLHPTNQKIGGRWKAASWQASMALMSGGWAVPRDDFAPTTPRCRDTDSFTLVLFASPGTRALPPVRANSLGDVPHCLGGCCVAGESITELCLRL